MRKERDFPPRLLKLLPAVLSFLLLTVPTASAGEQHFREGMLLLAENKPAEALAMFEKAAREQPEDAHSFYYLGVAALRAELYEYAQASFLESRRLDPGLEAVHRNLGRVYYHLGDYEPAMEELRVAEELAPDDAEPVFYQGLTLYHRGDYEASIALFSRAGELDNALRPAALRWEGEALRKTGQSALAREKFLESARLWERQPVFDEILVPVVKPPRQWRVGFMLGFEYDDNVTLVPEDRQRQARDDWRTVVGFNYRHRWLLGPGELVPYYRFYGAKHQRVSDYDLLGHTAGATYTFARHNLQPEVRYAFSFYRVDGEDYLQSHTVTPSLVVHARQNRRVRVYGEYERRDFLSGAATPEDNRDSKTYTGGTELEFPVFNAAGLQLGLGYEKNRAQGRNWRYAGPLSICTLEIPLKKEALTLSFTGRYQHRRFQRLVRDDDRWTFTLGLTRRIAGNTSIALYHTHIKNSSNIPEYSYRRNISSLLAGFGF